GFGNVGKRSVAIVVVKEVLPALQSRRPARHHDALVKTWSRFWHRRGRQIHVDIVSDKKIEAAVAIVIDERTSGIPALPLASHSCLLADVCERAVSIVV